MSTNSAFDRFDTESSVPAPAVKKRASVPMRDSSETVTLNAGSIKTMAPKVTSDSPAWSKKGVMTPDMEGASWVPKVIGPVAQNVAFQEALRHFVEQVQPAPVIPGFYGQIAPAPAVKKPSLKSFIAGTDEFEGSIWTPVLVGEALLAESWRARDVDETVREGDLICHEGADGAWCERALGYKDIVLTQELLETHGYTVFTLEGGGKPKKPVVIKFTIDYPHGLMSVPKGHQLKLPMDETEAKRFFGSDVFLAEISERGKVMKAYCPIPAMMANREFRRAFSRVFPDVAKRHFREHIKGLIEGRGQGLNLKKGISTRRIIDMIEGNVPGTKQKTKPMTVEQVSMELNVPVSTVNAFLARTIYFSTESGHPALPFVERMEARQLNPNDFGYDKSLGIEIETVSPLSHKDIEDKRLVPSFVRCTQDGSIRDMAGKKPEGNGPVWGVEFRILIKRSEMEARVMKAVNAIYALGAKVNKTCGLHVHFDMRDKTIEQAAEIGERVSKWLNVLKELLPASRRANQYCAFENADSPHHQAVSTFDSYKKHKTIEVRVHSSTLNTTKIINWVRLIEVIREMKYAPIPKTSTLDALKMLNLSEADKTYWLRRHHQLNPDQYKGTKADLGFLGDRAVDEVE